MGVSISSNYESRIIFTYFYIIVLSVIEWMENNHVGSNVSFCKIKTLELFSITDCPDCTLITRGKGSLVLLCCLSASH